MPVVCSQIKNIIVKSINLKDLEKRKNCFSLLSFYCIVDTSFNVWLQDITAQADLFTKGVIDEDIGLNIAAELIKIIMSQNPSFNDY